MNKKLGLMAVALAGVISLAGCSAAEVAEPVKTEKPVVETTAPVETSTPTPEPSIEAYEVKKVDLVDGKGMNPVTGEGITCDVEATYAVVNPDGSALCEAVGVDLEGL